MSRPPMSPPRLVVLTGATRGIGQAAAIEFARRGAELALVGRDAGRVEAVARQARAAGGDAPVHEHVADLTLMAEVRALAGALSERHQHIDVLANNAGALFATRRETSEGFERTFALNHLAPFLLTNLLRERLRGGRVVTTASDATSPGAWTSTTCSPKTATTRCAYTARRSCATSSSRASSPGARRSCTPTAFTPASCAPASARTKAACGSC